jgi:hypothetical protein
MENAVQCLYRCHWFQLISNIETSPYLKITRPRSPLPWTGVPAALHTAVYRTVKMWVLAVRVSVGQSSVGQLLTGCLFCTCWFNSLQHSGHHMYRTVVTLCTASLTFSNSTFCPHSVFMCFVWISEQTAIISLYNINWPVFITETECVYCAVRT